MTLRPSSPPPCWPRFPPDGTDARHEPAPLDARAIAQRAEVVASPVHPFRYNQPIPAPNQTKPLLSRRRAFFPAEAVTLSFRLPEGATLASPVRLKLTLALHDLLGAKLRDLGEATLSASSAAVEGTLAFTVPDVAEGQYLLAARFSGEDGQALASRSNVVWVTPEYPRLLAAAQAALDGARASTGVDLREIALPSTEMLVEDAEMRWSDFGQAPRDWDFVKRQLETAKAYADRLAAGEDPWKGRTGAFTKAYRSEVDGTLQPYGLYVPPSYDPARAWPMVVGLHGSGSNHLLHRRRLFGLGNQPGEQDYEAIRTDVAYPDVGFVVLTPYGRGESAGYGGIAEGDVLRAMDHVQKAYNVDADRVHLTGLSMGGGGTWTIGLRYPDRFASISPVCGVADMDLMPWTAGWGALDRELMSLTGVTRIAENAGNQQVFVFHGDEDDAVAVSASRKMMEAFGKAGLAGKKRPLLRAAGGHPLRVGLRLPRRVAVPARGDHPPQPLPRAGRLLDLLAPLQQGLLAAHRPHRQGPRARPDRGHAEGGRLRREGRQRLRLLPAALARDRARRASRSR